MTILVPGFFLSLDVASDGLTRVNYPKFNKIFPEAEGVYYRATCCNDECSDFEKSSRSTVITHDSAQGQQDLTISRLV